MKMMRRVIDGSTLLLGRIRRNQRIEIPVGFNPAKINMGCGLAVAPGWINIDGSLNAIVAALPRSFHRAAYRFTGASSFYTEAEYLRLLGEHYFVHHDLSYGLPLEDGVADFVYSSHFIEHLFKSDAENLLRESRRVLKTGGTVRIALPDLEYACSLYASGEKGKMLENYFFVSGDDSYYARHKYMYDYPMFAELLSRTGFRDIRRCGFREGRTPDLELLDNRPEDTVFVEAIK